jgi:hypothetical protein
MESLVEHPSASQTLPEGCVLLGQRLDQTAPLPGTVTFHPADDWDQEEERDRLLVRSPGPARSHDAG